MTFSLIQFFPVMGHKLSKMYANFLRKRTFSQACIKNEQNRQIMIDLKTSWVRWHLKLNHNGAIVVFNKNIGCILVH